MAGKIDIRQIDTNRRIMADSTVESPYNAVFDDTGADFPEMLYDRVPGDKIGLLPPNEKERSK